MAARQSTLVGVLIVLVSIFGAYVTWRAAAASGTASDLDQRARQARILEAQVRAENAAVIAFEQRVFAAYDEHHLLARALARDGEARRAQQERAAARSMELLFYAGYPYDEQARPRYRRDAAQQFLDADQRLDELRPGELEHAADRGRSRRFWLVVVDTALIASIFFSTLALLGAARRLHPATVGLALGIAAAAAYAFIELTVTVPAA